MRIQHNIASINAHRQLGNNNTAVGKNLEKLSSGFRINRAGDDAAGLAISEKMRGQIRGLDMATRNANDGISLIQTAEGALNETHSILQRMRELAVQSANGTYEEGVDRVQLNKEVTALKEEIDRIASSTHFNNQKLLNGELSAAGVPSTGAVGEATVTEATTGSLAVAGVKQESKITITAAKGGEQLQIGDKTFVFFDSTATGAVPPTGDNVVAIDVSTEDDATKQATAITDAFAADENWDVSNTLGVLTFEAKEAGANKDILVREWDDTGATATAIAAKAEVTAGTDSTEFVKAQNATSKFKIDAALLKAGGKLEIGGASFDIKTAEEYAKLSAADKETAIAEGTSQDDLNAKIIKGLNEAGFAHNVAAAGDDGSLTIQANADTVTTDDLQTAINAKYTAPAGGTAKTTGVTFQIGANGTADDSVNLKIENRDTKTLGIDGISIANREDANAAIEAISVATNSVSSTRADLGALQNRLEHTVANLGTSVENLTAAESRIRDVDMAKEMMEMTKNNILTQAAQAMLAQANTQPQSVLQLLQ